MIPSCGVHITTSMPCRLGGHAGGNCGTFSCHPAIAHAPPPRLHRSLLQSKTTVSLLPTREQQGRFPASFTAALLWAPSRSHYSFLKLNFRPWSCVSPQARNTRWVSASFGFGAAAAATNPPPPQPNDVGHLLLLLDPWPETASSGYRKVT